MTLEREAKIQKELKRRDNKRVAKGSFKKLGRQIRGHINPSSLKKTSLTRLERPDQDGVWKEIQGQGPIEEHIAQRNVEQFSNAGKPPFGYTELGEVLGHTGYSPLAEDILDGKSDHPALTNEAMHAIIKQLRHDTLVLRAERHSGDRPAGSYGLLFTRDEKGRGGKGKLARRQSATRESKRVEKRN
jgi:hypothetical protein